jgi:hypothetical protein
VDPGQKDNEIVGITLVFLTLSISHSRNPEVDHKCPNQFRVLEASAPPKQALWLPHFDFCLSRLQGVTVSLVISRFQKGH